jgi:hypothetical protein
MLLALGKLPENSNKTDLEVTLLGSNVMDIGGAGSALALAANTLNIKQKISNVFFMCI